MSLLRRVTLEVAVETPDDALAAKDGGADRIELCAALDLGGLTPSVGSFLEIRDLCPLPTVVMIRPRPGDFVYTDAEFRVMARDLANFVQHRPAAFVFGILRPSGRVDDDRCADLIRAAQGVPCVFHRAFDRIPSIAEAINALVRLRFIRVLTSGRESSALAGTAVITDTIQEAAGRIEVLPCGKVSAMSAPEIVRLTGCDQVHGSFAEPVPVPEGRGYRGYQQRSRTCKSAVARTRETLDARGSHHP